MESDSRPELYDRVAARLKEAHSLVRTAPVSDEARVALTRKLLVITAASKHDLASAERRLERMIRDLEAGRPEEDGHSDTTA